MTRSTAPEGHGPRPPGPPASRGGLVNGNARRLDLRGNHHTGAGKPDVQARSGATRPAAATQASARSFVAGRRGPSLGGVIVVVATLLIAFSVLGRYHRERTRHHRRRRRGVPARGREWAVPTGLRRRRRPATQHPVAGLDRRRGPGTLGLLGWKEVFGLTEADLALMTTAGTAVLGAALWTRHRVIVQQIVLMVALMATAAAAIADFVQTEALPGLGIWGVAVVWLLLGWGGILGPRPFVVPVSAAATVIGAIMTMQYDAGIVLAILTAAAIVSAAVLFRDLVLLAVGAAGALIVLPPAVSRWFPDSLAAPVALLAVGVLLVSSALWIARRRVRGGQAALAATTSPTEMSGQSVTGDTDH